LIEFLIKKLMGAERKKIFVTAQMDLNLPSSPGKTTYQMVKLYNQDDKIMASAFWENRGLFLCFQTATDILKT
jgi:molybdopterin molybdotransferase